MFLTINRPENHILRIVTKKDGPGYELRLLGPDYFGNHIRSTEQMAEVTEDELGEALETLMYKKIVGMAET